MLTFEVIFTFLQCKNVYFILTTSIILYLSQNFSDNFSSKEQIFLPQIFFSIQSFVSYFLLMLHCSQGTLKNEINLQPNPESPGDSLQSIVKN